MSGHPWQTVSRQTMSSAPSGRGKRVVATRCSSASLVVFWCWVVVLPLGWIAQLTCCLLTNCSCRCRQHAGHARQRRAPAAVVSGAFHLNRCPQSALLSSDLLSQLHTSEQNTVDARRSLHFRPALLFLGPSSPAYKNTVVSDRATSAPLQGDEAAVLTLFCHHPGRCSSPCSGCLLGRS